MDEKANVRRVNLGLRVSDAVEREAADIISGLPPRSRSHYIAMAIVAYASGHNLTGLSESQLDRIALAISSRLPSSPCSGSHAKSHDPTAPKRKRGRPPKNKAAPQPTIPTGERVSPKQNADNAPHMPAQEVAEPASKDVVLDDTLVQSMSELVLSPFAVGG